jgi:hypothetical protein
MWCKYKFAFILFFIQQNNSMVALTSTLLQLNNLKRNNARCYEWGFFRSEQHSYTIPGEKTVYKRVYAVASQKPSDHLAYPEEILNSLTPKGMSPHELELKLGAVLMLRPNLMPWKGLCNATRLAVTRLRGPV